MKIFLDTANIDAVKQLSALGIIDGITTNPTHLSREGTSPRAQIKELCALLPHGDISVEVTQSSPDDVYRQAQEIFKLADNISVKIPCHSRYYPVIDRLVKEGVSINVTLVFSVIQSLMMAKLKVAYISPFIGRWEDADGDGIGLLSDIRAMLDQYGYQTKLLAASLRTPRHLYESIMVGADVATVPPELLSKSLDHILTDQGIARFNADWKKLGVVTFP